MGLRRGSSLNVIRRGSTLAPDGAAVFMVRYTREAANGAIEYSDPTLIRVEVKRPNGTRLVTNYPLDSGDSNLIAITRLGEGRYAVQVYLGDLTGRWRLKVITDGGQGPSEEVEFEVVGSGYERQSEC